MKSISNKILILVSFNNEHVKNITPPYSTPDDHPYAIHSSLLMLIHNSRIDLIPLYISRVIYPFFFF